jgi:hypothetical protein
MEQAHHTRIGLRMLADYARRSVGGAVVDQHQLATQPAGVEHAEHALRELGDVQLFVEARHDHGKVEAGGQLALTLGRGISGVGHEAP